MDLNTFKFVVELAESYIREADMGAEEVVRRLRKVMEGYCANFAIGDLVQLADGRLGKVVDQTELFYWLEMPGLDGTQIAFPPDMTKVSESPTVEDVASDASLVLKDEECKNCGKSAGHWLLFCSKVCQDDFHCQGP